MHIVITKKLFSIFILFFLLFFFSCTKAQTVPDGIIHRVTIATAEVQVISEEVSGFGSLSYLTKIDIAASQDGTIRRLHYREGSIVPRGAIIAELENPQIDLALGRAENAYSQAESALRLSRSRLLEGEFRAEAEILSIEKAKAELEQAQRILEEQQRKADDQERLFAAGGLSEEAIRESRFSLSNAQEQLRLMERELDIRSVGLRDNDLRRAGLYPATGFASDQEYRFALIRLSTSILRAETEAAQAQLEASIKDLESMRIAKSELTIYSPAAGTVAARYLEVGERAKKEDHILTIIDTAALYVIFPLRESDALRLHNGMAARVSVDGTGEIYDGTVDIISPQADSQSFTFSVRVLLPQEIVAADDNLRPGMFARVRIQLGSESPVVVIPESAVVNRRDEEGTIFVVNQNRTSERTARFGQLYDDKLEIFSGLAVGEVVVVKPDLSLREGSYVIVDQ